MSLAIAEYLKSAAEKIAQSQWQEAKLNLEQAVSIEPRRWDIHFNLGVILAKQKQYTQAAAKFQRAIAIKPDYDWSYNNLGEAFLKLERVGDAVQAFIQAVTLNQNNPLFHYNLGEALIKKNSLDRATECFREAMALNSQDCELQFKLGKSFRNQGLIAESITCFCKAIELDSNYTFAYISLRYTPTEAEQRDRLIDFYQKILVDYPHQPEAMANLAELLAVQGNISEGITFSRQAVQAKTVRENPNLAQADWHFKKKAPDFIIIGVGKSGTTSLYRYLGKHPQILLPNKKELRFFDRNFERGYQWYLAQFPSICDRSDLLTGEASPSYFFKPHAAQRLYDFAPETKIIVMLRNPVDRSISGYYQNQKLGIKHETLEATIEREIEIINQKSEAELAYGGSILGESLYYYKLKRWMKIFPRNQFLIINSQDFFSHPAKFMAETFQFLDLPVVDRDKYQKHNVGSYPQVTSEVKQQLKDFFVPHNQKLAEFLNTNFSW